MNFRISIIACLIVISSSSPVYSQPKTLPPPPAPGVQAGTIDGHLLVAVKGGCYLMGSDSGAADEQPVHEVCVDDFFLGRYEVTQEQWRQVMGENPSYFGRGGNYPVEQVSWNDVQAYLDRLNRRSGRNFRLPTEAEWEYACRSGGKDEKYCGGDAVDSLAWHDANSNGATHPVGTRQPNTLGLYDMSGNVWEWTGDRFDPAYYAASPRTNPLGSGSGSDRVFRGGAWNFKTKYLRATSRFWLTPDDRHFFLGFRLALPSAQ
ncbi:MAG: formylglycine-generating enzyme family protein [Proteobacteria bacterium]|nr:formylglycine-generating enzyme family protein [Pseudomonadota bacterium]MBU1737262.1 formylglycine-generating enzyme family protein [Pseudomonadota bacterium]